MQDHKELWQSHYLTKSGLMTPETMEYIKLWHNGYSMGNCERIGKDSSVPETAIKHEGDKIIWKSKSIKGDDVMVCVGERTNGSQYAVMIDYGLYYEIKDIEDCFCYAVNIRDIKKGKKDNDK